MSMHLFSKHIGFSDRFIATILYSDSASPLGINLNQFTSLDIKAGRWASKPEGPLLFGFHIIAIKYADSMS